MKPEDINRAIAIYCDYIKCVCDDPECGAWFPPEGESTVSLPNYYGDLNAMHEAKNYLLRQNPDNRWKYENYIEEQLDWDTGPDGECNSNHYLLIHATSQQRAEAFLKTIGKWL